jgi:hypothetical protein
MNTGEESVDGIKQALKVEVLPTFRFFKDGHEMGVPVTGYKKTLLKDQVMALASSASS